MPGQLKLFDPAEYFVRRSASYEEQTIGPSISEGGDWPSVATSTCGRYGFWRERSPSVFGGRVGIGPLLIVPDTNLLISIRKELEEIEASNAGLILRAVWSDRSTPLAALSDVVQLWIWRDVRFWTCEVHLRDARKPMSEAQRAARDAAIRELTQDFFDRGGFEAVVPDDLDVEGHPCSIHALLRPRAPKARSAPAARRWPAGTLDRELLAAAYESGCHVFLTEDKGILKCHDSFADDGLAILTPTQLLDALDRGAELDAESRLDTPFPDISVLSRLYSGFGEID